MIKVLDSNKQVLHLLNQVKDYYIESNLATGDKLISFKLPKALGINLMQEDYLLTKDHEFVIKEVNHSDNNYFEIFGKLNLEELRGKIYSTYESVQQPLSIILPDLLNGTGWNYQIIDPVVKSRTIRTEVNSVYDLLIECCKTYNVEVEFDTLNQTVKLYQTIGTNRGAYVYSDLNLKKADYQSDTYDYKTRLRAYGANGLTFAAINGGNDYIDNNQYSNKIVEMLWVDNRYTDAQALLDDATIKLAELSKPRLSFTIDVLNLVGVRPEYNILDFRLGDTVKVMDKYNGIVDTQRIVKLIEYPITPELNKAEFSNTKITFVDNKKEIEAVSQGMIRTRTDLMNAIDSVTSSITGNTGGFIVTRLNEDNQPYELLIMDTDDVATAANVWRWNVNGLGFSSTGYNGSYETAITQDGEIVANFITAGTLSAGLIKSGLLQSNDGSSYLNMEDGTFNFADKLIFNGTTFTINLGSGQTVEEAIAEGGIAKASTAPLDPTPNQLWLDSGTTPNQLRRWDGTEWVEITSSEVYTAINAKADQGAIDTLGDNLSSFISIMPTPTEFTGLMNDLLAYQALLTTQTTDLSNAKAQVADLLARTASLEVNLGATVQKWLFLDTFMTVGEEGLYIGAQDGSAGIRVGVDTETNQGRVDFLDGNGDPVASITSQVMTINRGIFVTSAQIGQHKMETVGDGITIFTWIPLT